MQGVQDGSLVEELRSHMPHSQKPHNINQKQSCKKLNRKTLKMVHIKKNNKKYYWRKKYLFFQKYIWYLIFFND